MYYTVIAGQIYDEHMTRLPLPFTFFYLAGIIAVQYLPACEVSICCCWWFSPLWIWWCWLPSCFARSTILKNVCVCVCVSLFVRGVFGVWFVDVLWWVLFLTFLLSIQLYAWRFFEQDSDCYFTFVLSQVWFLKLVLGVTKSSATVETYGMKW